jgi:mannonate dehydratase
VGCWSEIGSGGSAGSVVLDAIRYFGKSNKLLYVHFRDVKGTVPNFAEAFVNEGNQDMFIVMRTLKEVGFSGFMICDHVPHMVDDTPWGHRGRAYAIGYMTGLLQAANAI